MKTKKQLAKEMIDTLSRWDIARMYVDVNKRYQSIIKFLHHNHKPILREWEATQGKLRIEFLGDKT